jgi:hypothetical protein
MDLTGARDAATLRATRDLKFQAPPAFRLSSTQDYAAAISTRAVDYAIDPRRINP